MDNLALASLILFVFFMLAAGVAWTVINIKQARKINAWLHRAKWKIIGSLFLCALVFAVILAVTIRV